MEKDNLYKPIHFFEIWKVISVNEIPWIREGMYKLSSFGKVYSYFHNRLLCPMKDEHNYYCIDLASNCGRARRIRLNRLVLMVFNPIPNPENFIAHHLNNNPEDNSLHNLMWVDSAFNTRYAMRYGNLHPEIFNAGENSYYAKITENQALNIIDQLNSGKYTIEQVAKLNNTTDGTVKGILYGKTWKYLNANINFTKQYNHLFSDDELEKICTFFESNDINNKQLFPTKTDLFRKCLKSCGLYMKYNEIDHFHPLNKILTKSSPYYYEKAKKYSYNWTR